MALAFDKVRFLLIEDHEPSIQILRTLLKALGVQEAAAVRTVAAGLAKLETDRIDIVILDLLLGADSGLDFLAAIRREDSRHAFLPVLVLSAHTDKARVEAARDAGATEVCAKPVSPAEVYKKIVSMIAEPRLYIRSDGYFGPDRRRHGEGDYEGDERRTGKPAGATNGPPAGAGNG